MLRLIKEIRRALPRSCIVCGQHASRDFSLCSHCEDNLPKLEDFCLRCGVQFDGRHSQDSYCPSCQLSPPAFDSCRTAFCYSSPIDRLIADFKFSARLDIGYSLSRILADAFRLHYTEKSRPQLLLPVPLHSSRLRARGFNQADEICKVLSRCCQIPRAPYALTKIRKTEPQTSMSSAEARKSNLRNAFELQGLEAVTHIALVDDVVTTMATVESISRLLRNRSNCRIDVWCLARAGR